MQISVILLLTVVLGVYGEDVMIEPELITGTEGETVTISCIVGPIEPSSTQILTDDNQQLLTNDQNVQSDRVVYTYGPLVPSDEGRTVTCRYAGMDAVGTISVLFPARYSLTDTTHTVSEGDSFTVNLTVMANPQPTDEETTWTYRDVPLIQGVTGTANSLSFVNINREQSGVYTVRSTTNAGTSMTFDVTINVLYPPMFTEALSSGIVCERTNSPYTCAIMEGSSGTLNCAASGNPPPEISLSRPIDRVTLNAETGQVMISGATDAENDVRVTCTASSGNFDISREFILNVGRGPAQPNSVMATILNDTLTVTWVYSDPNNNLPLRRFLYTVRVESSGMVLMSGSVGPTELRLTLDLAQGFEQETQYDLELRADNLLGSSTAGGVRFTTAAVTGTIDNTGGSVTSTASLLSVLLMLCLTLVFRL